MDLSKNYPGSTPDGKKYYYSLQSNPSSPICYSKF